ncbi:MAG: hypothetical protein K2K80_01595 [Clostridia bacterium]|nr:hypothetical protein [Clostridia bacterium]
MVIMENLCEVFESSEAINIYKEGVKTSYSVGEKEYIDILSCWNKMIENSREMPAFGVSLNHYTLAEMKNGLWVEFEFDGKIEVNGMDFEKLLIDVRKEHSGFNLIRYNSRSGYDGRCYYLDLVDKNMAVLYDILQKI